MMSWQRISAFEQGLRNFSRDHESMILATSASRLCCGGNRCVLIIAWIVWKNRPIPALHESQFLAFEGTRSRGTIR